MKLKNNSNLKNANIFLKLLTSVVMITLSVGFINRDFIFIKPNHNTYSFSEASLTLSNHYLKGKLEATENGHITWQLIKNQKPETYTLIINGQGNMVDNKYLNDPWNDYNDKITKVIVSGNVNNISDHTLCNCKLLSQVDMPYVKKIGNQTFMDCPSLINVNIPNVKEISGASFFRCPMLKVVCMDNVEKIGEGSFMGSSLETIYLPKVKLIGEYAFADCLSLKKATLCKNVKIEPFVFDNTKNIKFYYIDPPLLDLENVVNQGNCGEIGHESDLQWYLTQNDDGQTFTLVINGKGKMKDYVITNLNKDQIIIDFPWFEAQDKITQVLGSKDVTYIGNNAFSNLESLEKVMMSGVKETGEAVFKNCISLKEANMESLETITKETFMNCNLLKQVKIPQVVKIGYKAFMECYSLSTLKTSNVKIIDSYAFLNCISLKNIDLSNVIKIGAFAFEDCIELKKLEMPNVSEIDIYAFIDCSSLKEVTLPNIKTIGHSAFECCPLLDTVILPSIKTITMGDNIFKDSNNVVLYDLTGKEIIIDSTPTPLSSEMISPDITSNSFSRDTDNSIIDASDVLEDEDFDDDLDEDLNAHFDKELIDIDQLHSTPKTMLETTEPERSENSQTDIIDTKLPNNETQNEGLLKFALLAVMLIIIGGAWGIISKKQRQNK